MWARAVKISKVGSDLGSWHHFININHIVTRNYSWFAFYKKSSSSSLGNFRGSKPPADIELSVEIDRQKAHFF